MEESGDEGDVKEKGRESLPAGIPDELPEEVIRELEGVPDPFRETLTRVIAHQRHSGPLPHPSHAAAYEQIQPGSFDRILAMAEEHQRHRHTLESKLLTADIADRKQDREERRIGQYCGLAIGVVTVVAGVVTAWVGHPITAGFIGTSGVLGLVSVFVIGKRFEHQESSRIDENHNELSSGQEED